jgi:hypothetical protein
MELGVASYSFIVFGALSRMGGHCGSPGAIQTTYKDSGVGMSWLMVTKTKNHEWRLLMKVKMQVR